MILKGGGLVREGWGGGHSTFLEKLTYLPSAGEGREMKREHKNRLRPFFMITEYAIRLYTSKYKIRIRFRLMKSLLRSKALIYYKSLFYSHINGSGGEGAHLMLYNRINITWMISVE